MKKYTHAWIALKALDYLKLHQTSFCKERSKSVGRFLDFMSDYPSTFVRGAWFPDSVISDNTQGGHTWKYSLHKKGRVVTYRPPGHNACMGFVKQDLDKPVKLDLRISDLPDRCEALSQTIRDMILITNKTDSGDVVAFNNSQIALLFLMLSHYVADAHVPVHCDKRDFYKPSHIHPDMEAFWEKEVKRYCSVSTKAEQFDLDAMGSLQVNTSKSGWSNSALKACETLLQQTTWQNMGTTDDNWTALLGKGNKNIWDYLVGVCRVSFQMSVLMFPIKAPTDVDYDTVRIHKTAPFKSRLEQYSPNILADAVMSVALLWLATWERWELLKKGQRYV